MKKEDTKVINLGCRLNFFESEVIKNQTYISHSMYAAQLKPFIKLFPIENFLFLTQYQHNEEEPVKPLLIFWYVRKYFISELYRLQSAIQVQNASWSKQTCHVGTDADG